MFRLYASSWLVDRTDPNEDRDRMHRIALHEARIATDARASRADDVARAASQRTARLARLRMAMLAISPGTSRDIAACCA